MSKSTEGAKAPSANSLIEKWNRDIDLNLSIVQIERIKADLREAINHRIGGIKRPLLKLKEQQKFHNSADMQKILEVRIEEKEKAIKSFEKLKQKIFGSSKLEEDLVILSGALNATDDEKPKGD